MTTRLHWRLRCLCAQLKWWARFGYCDWPPPSVGYVGDRKPTAEECRRGLALEGMALEVLARQAN